MELNEQQKQALKLIVDWYHNSDKQVFRLFGYAGTGKTTILKNILKELDVDTQVCAFTGKACDVLQQKGIDAETIHSAFKYLYGYELKNGDIIAKEDYGAYESEVKQPYFKDYDIFEYERDLIVVDECSMLNEELLHTITKYDIKVLALGDPAQLPPVTGTSPLMDKEPDYLLTQIMRQGRSKDALAILDIATKIRENKPYTLNLKQFERFSQANIILCYMNKTRKRMNNYMRRKLKLKDILNVGENVICLKNNKKQNLFNGQIWIVKEIKEIKGDSIVFIGESRGEEQKITIDTNTLINTLPAQRGDKLYFNYAYCLTVHKAQGSEWDNVVIYDDVFGDNVRTWWYTALTRAVSKVLIWK